MANNYEVKYHLFGVPTNETLVTQQHLDLIDEENVVFVMHANMFEEVDGYNFFKQQDFNFCEYSEVPELLSSNTKRIIFNINSYDVEWNPARIQEDLRVQYISALLDDLKEKLGGAKIVFSCFGNVLHYRRYLYEFARRPEKHKCSMVNTKSSTNGDVEIFHSISNILWGNEFSERAYKNETPYDRSGIFVESGSRLPSLDVAPKPIFDILDERAESFRSSNNLILWSGGVDSTAILAAFSKNNVPFKVTVSDHTRFENQELHDYVVQNFDHITIDNTFDLTTIAQDYKIIHGGCADALFPRCRWDCDNRGETGSYPHFKTITAAIARGSNTAFGTPYDMQAAYELSLQPIALSSIQTGHEYWELLSDMLQSRKLVKRGDTEYLAQIKQYVDDKIAKWPLPITYHYELEFMFRFIFSYHFCVSEMIQRVIKTNGNDVIDFFNTDSFQQWSLINFADNVIDYTETPLRERYFLKEYAYNYFNIESILEKTKLSSLLNVKK
jgi:hypothetical protein